MPERVVAQAMNIGDCADVQSLAIAGWRDDPAPCGADAALAGRSRCVVSNLKMPNRDKAQHVAMDMWTPWGEL